MSRKAINLRILGIKCDHCDYVNPNVDIEEYKDWLNKSCPVCGNSLLTQKDYEGVKRLVKVCDIINRIFNIFSPIKADEKMIKGEIEMNGTGKMFFKLREHQ